MYGKCFKYDNGEFIMVRSGECNGLVDCTRIRFDEYYAHLAKGSLLNAQYIRDHYTEITLSDFTKAYKDFLQAADVIYKDAIKEREGE